MLIFFLLSIAAHLFLINPADGDELRLKNGDRISGKLLTMEEGNLTFRTSYAGEISIRWEDISTLSTEAPIRVVLSDDTALNGLTLSAEAGKMKIKMGKIVETVIPFFHFHEDFVLCCRLVPASLRFKSACLLIPDKGHTCTVVPP